MKKKRIKRTMAEWAWSLAVSIGSRLIPVVLMIIQRHPRLRQLALDVLRVGATGHVSLPVTSSGKQESSKGFAFQDSWDPTIPLVKARLYSCQCTSQKEIELYENKWSQLAANSPLESFEKVIGTCDRKCAADPANQANQFNSPDNSQSQLAEEIVVIAEISSVPTRKELLAGIFALQSSSQAVVWGDALVLDSEWGHVDVKLEVRVNDPSTKGVLDPEEPVIGSQSLIIGNLIFARKRVINAFEKEVGAEGLANFSSAQLEISNFLFQKGWSHGYVPSLFIPPMGVERRIQGFQAGSSAGHVSENVFLHHRMVRNQILASEKWPSGANHGFQKKRALIIQPVIGGGLVHADQLMAEAMSSRYDLFWLQTSGQDISIVRRELGTGETHQLLTDEFVPVAPNSHRSSSYDAFLYRALAVLGIDVVIVQHLAQQSLGIREVCLMTQTPYFMVGHDFYVACVSHNLLDDRGNFCGGKCTPGTGSCQTSAWPSSDFPNLKNEQVYAHRQRVRAVCRDAVAVITPDQSAASLLLEIFGKESMELSVLPFPVPAIKLAPKHRKISRRVIAIGDIRENKGSELLSALAPRLSEKGIELHFLGSTHPYLRQFGVHHGPYKPEDLTKKIEKIGADLVLLTSPWPETFSFVLSEALCHGLPILARDIGAFGSRLADMSFAILVSSKDPDEWLKAIDNAYSPGSLEQLQASLQTWQDLHDPKHSRAEFEANLLVMLEKGTQSD